MPADLRRGRQLVMLCAAAMLSLEVFAVTLAASLGRLTPLRIGQVTVRTALAVLIIFFLLRGAPWARWLTATLYGAGGVGAVFLLPGAFRTGNTVLLAFDLFLVTAGISLALVLVFSPSAKLYISEARQNALRRS